MTTSAVNGPVERERSSAFDSAPQMTGLGGKRTVCFEPSTRGKQMRKRLFELMLSFDPRPIRDALHERGVALNQPVAVDALERLTHWAGGSPHPDVIALLQEFDGFANVDIEEASFVSVWPVDKAIADHWTKRPMLAFSDWSLNAIIFGFDPLVGGPVVSIEDAQQVAPTYRDFWHLLLSDRLL